MQKNMRSIWPTACQQPHLVGKVFCCDAFGGFFLVTRRLPVLQLLAFGSLCGAALATKVCTAPARQGRQGTAAGKAHRSVWTSTVTRQAGLARASCISVSGCSHYTSIWGPR